MTTINGLVTSGTTYSYLEDPNQFAPLTVERDPLTGGLTGILDPATGKPGLFVDQRQIPIVCIGGDHQYLAWWGTNGANGMYALYAALGMPTYNAICWDLEPGSSGNFQGTFSDLTTGMGGDFMTTAQALELQAKGLEFVAHGTRHPNNWDMLNSGIRIDYLGAAATATVLINGDGVHATEIVMACAGGADDATLTISSYATLTALKAAIDAAAGGTKWLCWIAQELIGTEDPKWLWPISAARQIKGTALADVVPFNNRRFCISGGVYFQYTGWIYKNCVVQVGADGAIKVFLDGVRAGTYAPTTQTMTTMLAALNTAVTTTFAAAGFTALLMDNGYASSPTLKRESYMSGDELAVYLTRTMTDCAGRAQLVTYGYTWQYIVKRQAEHLNTVAAAAGFNLKNMAQAGSRLPSRAIGLLPYNESRIEASTFGVGGINPYPIPANLDVPWHTMCTMSSSRTLDELKSSIDALCESGPWAVDYLIHNFNPDGSSGYQFPTTEVAFDMTEADGVAALTYLAAKKNAGLLEVLAPEQFRIARRARGKPKNLVFNPKFCNRVQHGGAALLRCITAAAGSNGWAIPGWQIYFPSNADVTVGLTSVTVNADGSITFVTAGALNPATTPLACALWMERGKSYDCGFTVDASGLTSAASTAPQVVMRSARLRPEGLLPQSLQPFAAGKLVYPGTQGVASIRFALDQLQPWTPERIMGKVGPYNLTEDPAYIRVAHYGLGTTADINIAGASFAATTATEIAAKINAAVAADANYVNYPELWTAAKNEGGRLVIEAGRRNQTPLSSGLALLAGTSTTGKLAIIFGSGEVQTFGTAIGAENSGSTLYWMEVSFPAAMNGTVTISNPFCTEITSG